MSVTGQAGNGVEAIELFRQEQPDVTLFATDSPSIINCHFVKEVISCTVNTVSLNA